MLELNWRSMREHSRDAFKAIRGKQHVLAKPKKLYVVLERNKKGAVDCLLC